MLELEANEANGHNIEDEVYTDEPEEPQVSWQIIFKEQRQMILELWHVCYVSIIHRTQFYLLFKGDPADQIYMEVELRRLTWLQQHLAELGNASPAPHVGDEPTISLSSRFTLSFSHSLYTHKHKQNFCSMNYECEFFIEYMFYNLQYESLEKRERISC